MFFFYTYEARVGFLYKKYNISAFFLQKATSPEIYCQNAVKYNFIFKMHFSFLFFLSNHNPIFLANFLIRFHSHVTKLPVGTENKFYRFRKSVTLQITLTFRNCVTKISCSFHPQMQKLSSSIIWNKSCILKLTCDTLVARAAMLIEFSRTSAKTTYLIVLSTCLINLKTKVASAKKYTLIHELLPKYTPIVHNESLHIKRGICHVIRVPLALTNFDLLHFQ